MLRGSTSLGRGFRAVWVVITSSLVKIPGLHLYTNSKSLSFPLLLSFFRSFFPFLSLSLCLSLSLSIYLYVYIYMYIHYIHYIYTHIYDIADPGVWIEEIRAVEQKVQRLFGV